MAHDENTHELLRQVIDRLDDIAKLLRPAPVEPEPKPATALVTGEGVPKPATKPTKKAVVNTDSPRGAKP